MPQSPRSNRVLITAVLVAVLVAVLAPPPLYLLAVHVSPPLTADGHRVMPIAQVGFALILSAVLSVVAALLVALAGRK